MHIRSLKSIINLDFSSPPPASFDDNYEKMLAMLLMSKLESLSGLVSHEQMYASLPGGLIS